MKDVKITFTTDGSGDATATTADLTGRKLKVVEWIDGDLADGVDAVFTVGSRPSGITRTILTLTNANNDARYPLGETLYDATGGTITGSYAPIYIDGKVTVTVSSGGSVKSGACYLYLE